MHPNQFLVEPERGAAGRESEDGVRLFADDVGDYLGAENATDLGRITNENFHGDRSGWLFARAFQFPSRTRTVPAAAVTTAAGHRVPSQP